MTVLQEEGCVMLPQQACLLRRWELIRLYRVTTSGRASCRWQCINTQDKEINREEGETRCEPGGYRCLKASQKKCPPRWWRGTEQQERKIDSPEVKGKGNIQEGWLLVSQTSKGQFRPGRDVLWCSMTQWKPVIEEASWFNTHSMDTLTTR